jgi:hypothetical protein
MPYERNEDSAGLRRVLDEDFWPDARPQVEKARQSYLNNTARTFSTENAAAGQKNRPKPKLL